MDTKNLIISIVLSLISILIMYFIVNKEHKITDKKKKKSVMYYVFIFIVFIAIYYLILYFYNKYTSTTIKSVSDGGSKVLDVPEVKTQSVKAPNVKAPSVKAPSVKTPVIKKLDVKVPDVAEVSDVQLVKTPNVKCDNPDW